MAKTQRNYGMLASLDWNSNLWKAPSTLNDLNNSDFGFVNEFGFTYTCLNFGQDIFPTDADGFYSGLLPHTYSRPANTENSKDVKIVFLKSKNWEDGIIYLIGFYAFPILKKGKKKSPLIEISYDFETNIKALPKDILLLENYINLSAHPQIQKVLPKDKEQGKQGFNYLTKNNVEFILDELSRLNPQNTKLASIKFRILKALGNVP
ncbi:hypothetical protein GVN20_05515 [Runella sp. CRIBMP]|uniref:hypothetical protein n=1 Tax=Runella sp. CRIBMP TaxID=2683261 RepID=UPI001412DE01|nr:hypothetical protein [Runella sp. CRIBMP]NBB18808.1 hypothetical protein [Runella sp. CRIBMP]